MEVLIYLCSVAVLFSVSATAAQEQFKHIAPVTIDEDRYLQLLSRVENLEKRDQEQKEDIHMLRSELTTEKQRASRLEAKITRLMRTLSKHRGVDRRTALDVEGSRDQDADTVNTENVSDTRYAKHSGAPASRIRRQEDIQVIAFHATLTSDLQHTGVNQAIDFDHAITNIGSAYNPHFGTFVAPFPGVYVFSTTVAESFGMSALHCSIVKNGGSVANLYMRDEKAVYESDSATVVLHLNKGDDVAVQNNDADTFIRGDHYSMFSGFLLQEDQPGSTIVGK